jgi:hypothetical protein
MQIRNLSSVMVRVESISLGVDAVNGDDAHEPKDFWVGTRAARDQRRLALACEQFVFLMDAASSAILLKKQSTERRLLRLNARCSGCPGDGAHR